ncbi:MAG: AsmA family protein, partial [Gammaproteobacteria bacterium]
FAGDQKPAAQQPKKTKVFSSDPLPLEGLQAADINISLKAKQIKTADLSLENVNLALSLVNGKLAINPLTANTGGGTLAMQMNLGAGSGKTAALDTSIDIKNFEPSTLPDFKDEISGGKTDVTLKGRGTGNSVAAIMAGLNGSLLMKMGPGILKSSKANAATTDMLVSTYQLLYPGAKGSKDTEIQCGVVNFNIKDGIASTDKGIAFATNKMNIIGSGVVDLKTEKLDIGINPQAREGVGISAAQLAELVRVGGTLAEPKAVPDTMAALKTAASVGTAVATGGLSLIVGGLSDKSEADPDPCATALGVKPKATATTTQKEQPPKSTTEKTVDTVKDTGSAIGDKLKGLFGK